MSHFYVVKCNKVIQAFIKYSYFPKSAKALAQLRHGDARLH